MHRRVLHRFFFIFQLHCVWNVPKHTIALQRWTLDQQQSAQMCLPPTACCTWWTPSSYHLAWLLRPGESNKSCDIKMSLPRICLSWQEPSGAGDLGECLLGGLLYDFYICSTYLYIHLYCGILWPVTPGTAESNSFNFRSSNKGRWPGKHSEWKALRPGCGQIFVHKNMFILMLDDAQRMAGDTRYTLFAPTNDAFQSLGIGVATSLLMPTNQDGDQTCYFKFSQIKLKWSMTEVVKVGPGETVSNCSVSLVIRHVRIAVKLVFCVFQSQQFLAANLVGFTPRVETMQALMKEVSSRQTRRCRRWNKACWRSVALLSLSQWIESTGGRQIVATCYPIITCQNVLTCLENESWHAFHPRVFAFYELSWGSVSPLVVDNVGTTTTDIPVSQLSFQISLCLLQ